MHSFTIHGKLPGLNEYIDAERGGGGRYRAAAMKKKVQRTIIVEAQKQLRGVRFTGPVTMHYLWIEPNRKRDKDNIAFAKKFVQDALVEAGVLINDGWKHIGGFTDDFDVDQLDPRIVVTIKQVEELQ